MKLAILLAGVLTAAAAPPDLEKKVVVDGATYRVTVVAGVVTVAKKATVVKFNIQERDKMREAVKLATGCAVTDEIPSGAKLKGKLNCER